MFLIRKEKTINFKLLILDLLHKTAWVCGGSQGLGLATAKELALLGANIILVSRSKEKLEKALGELDRTKGQHHESISLDLSEPEEVKRAIDEYLAKGNNIEILINNAGGPPSAAMMDTSTIEMEKAFKTHVITSHTLVQAILPGMKAGGYGRIINIVSTSVKQPINGLGIQTW